MKKLILIKLGGSVISDKTKVNKARNYEIKKLSRQIKEIARDYSLIIFTGAGGFGHPLAEKYHHNLEKGLPEIKKAVKELNQIIVDSLNKVGLKAKSVEPDKVARYKNGKLATLLDSDTVSLLNKGIIPVFHADLVHDKKLGISILSMDKFLVDLAIYFKNKRFKIDKIIFVGTTSGVVDRNGKIIEKITKGNFPKIKVVFYKGKGVDVTGGMKYKVEQCLRLAEEGIDSFITNDLEDKGTVISR